MRDTFGLIPPDIRARLAREEMIERCLGKKNALNEELRRQFGDHVDCVLIGVPHDPSDLPESAIAGRWHVRVDKGPPFMPQYIPIVTEDGGYREPNFDIIPRLAERDLRRPGVMQAMIDRTRNDSPHKAAERALKKEQRIDVAKEDFRAAKRCTDEGLKGSYASKRKLAERSKAKA